MVLDVLPLRAIAYQLLFLLLAIAIEGMVFRRFLTTEDKPIAYKIAMQYSASVNLLSTFIGWIVFFVVEPLLPGQLQLQLVSYVFYERLFPNAWLVSIAPIVVISALGVFVGTFFVELGGLDALEVILKRKAKDEEKAEDTRRVMFRGRKKQSDGLQLTSKVYATLLANAVSFSAILLLLLTRLIDQGQFSIL